MDINSEGFYVSTFGKIRIGGLPGTHPPVMIGSLFYKGHNIFYDKTERQINRDHLETQIDQYLEFSDKTGLPVMFDIIGENAEELIARCQMISEYSECPFLVDGINDDTNISTLAKLKEVGLLNRAIYNCIHPLLKEEHIQELKNIKIQNAVLLCFYSRALLPEQKIQILLDTKEKNERSGLLEISKDIGVKEFIVDTGVLDMPSIGLNAITINRIKYENKLPVGCAPINALAEWSYRRYFGKKGQDTSTAAVCEYLLENGADWLIFGGIDKAERVIPSVALTYSLKSRNRKQFEKKESERISFEKLLR